jgi:hypothetical protein
LVLHKTRAFKKDNKGKLEMEIEERQVRSIVTGMLQEQGLYNFIKIFEKEHNIFRGTHSKIENYPSIKHAETHQLNGKDEIEHGFLKGLADDDHLQYALLAGRIGGQVLSGGVAPVENLYLHSTANATKGNICLGAKSFYDEINDWLGIGGLPEVDLHINKPTQNIVTALISAKTLPMTRLTEATKNTGYRWVIENEALCPHLHLKWEHPVGTVAWDILDIRTGIGEEMGGTYCGFVFDASLFFNSLYLHDGSGWPYLRIYQADIEPEDGGELGIKVNEGYRIFDLSGDLTLNEDFVIGNGYAGTLTFSAASKVLTVAGNCSLNQSLLIASSPAFVGLTLSGMSSAGFVKNTAAGILSGGNSILRDDVITFWSAPFWASIPDVPSMISSLGGMTDPNADRITFWDESENALKFLVPSTGIQIVGTNLLTKDSEIAHDSLSGVHQNVNTAASPAFVGLDLTGLTDGYVPYVGVGALANSPIYTDGTNFGIGMTEPNALLDISGGAGTGGIQIGGTGTAIYQANKIKIDNNAGNARFYVTGPNASTKGSYDFWVLTSDNSASIDAVTIANTGNVGIGTSDQFGSGVKVIGIGNATTPPSTGIIDAFVMYGADIQAGEAAPHFYTEHGDIIKLYQQSHLADPTDLATLLTWAAAINTRLENLGFHATS